MTASLNNKLKKKKLHGTAFHQSFSYFYVT